jgi:hypothetical protein
MSAIHEIRFLMSLFGVCLPNFREFLLEHLKIKADEDSVRNNQEPEQRQIIPRSEIRTAQPKPAPEYGNLQNEAIAFPKRIPNPGLSLPGSKPFSS